MAKERLSLRVNGAVREIEADPATPLIYVLRGQCGLTGVKLGCGLEQCGSCAVLIDGEPTLCCNRPVGEVTGKEIVTVEGLVKDGSMNAVQSAFVDEGAAQCGYCTPGIVIAATALLRKNKTPSDTDIIEALHPHLCRCGSHPRVLKAIRRVVTEGRTDAV